jgi:gluconokinase
MAGREHEFMPVTLLSSQLEALEPLEPDERHMLLDVRQSPAALAEHVVTVLLSGASEPLLPPAGEKAVPAP